MMDVPKKYIIWRYTISSLGLLAVSAMTSMVLILIRALTRSQKTCTMNKFTKLTTAIIQSKFYRSLSLTASVPLKQIDVLFNGNETTVRGVTVPSPRDNYMMKPEHHDRSACSLCITNLDIKHTDVLILSQYLRSDGCMLPRRITGLCKRQQKRISILVAMSQKAGLMPNINPSYSHKDPKLRYGWKKYNKYFDESTINLKYY